MSLLSYYGFTVLFLVGTVLTAIAALKSSSVLRFTVPFSVALSMLVGYFGLDHFLGTAKPVGTVPGWSQPVFGKEGATVIGAKISSDGIYMMLQEEGSVVPRLFAFPPNKEMGQNLRQAMENHAKANKGKEFGFKVKSDGEEEGEVGTGKSGKGEKGKPGKDGNHSGSEEKSLEDRPSPFKFDEPQPQAMPPKYYPGGGPGYTEYKAPGTN